MLNRPYPQYFQYSADECAELAGNASVIIPAVAVVGGSAGSGSAFQAVDDEKQ
jgi:hypothetical protein